MISAGPTPCWKVWYGSHMFTRALWKAWEPCKWCLRQRSKNCCPWKFWQYKWRCSGSVFPSHCDWKCGPHNEVDARGGSKLIMFCYGLFSSLHLKCALCHGCWVSLLKNHLIGQQAIAHLAVPSPIIMGWMVRSWVQNPLSAFVTY